MVAVDRILHITAYPYAECQHCDWTWPESRTTRARAKDHVKETNHVAVVVVENRSAYRQRRTA